MSEARRTFTIRAARPGDEAAMRALLPRLADFDVPAHRNPEHLWRGDERLLLAWLAGDAPQCFALVACAAGDDVLGLALVSLRQELLSGAPSAHLEAIAVTKGTEGGGVGRGLLAAAEHEAARRGAASMSLHVFANNHRARALYETSGYDGEIVRYFKVLDADG